MESLLLYNYGYDGLGCGIITWLIIALVVGIGINIALCCLAGRIADRKGYSYWGFWWLTFFIGIIGLIIAACLSDNSRRNNNTQVLWFCRKCGRSNNISASFCSNCGEPKMSTAPKYSSNPHVAKPVVKTEPKEVWTCPECGYKNNINATMCINCGKAKP